MRHDRFGRQWQVYLQADGEFRQRAESVSNVKRTNGQLSFESIARSKDEA